MKELINKTGLDSSCEFFNKLCRADRKWFQYSISKKKLTLEEFKFLFAVFSNSSIPEQALLHHNFLLRVIDESIKYEYMQLSQFGIPEDMMASIFHKTKYLPNFIQVYLALVVKNLNFNNFEQELRRENLVWRKK